MTISNEAVEAAVHAYMQYPRTRGIDNTENMFRAALEAAAPYIAAQAWDEAVSALVYEDGTKVELATNTNPYRG